MAKFPPAGIRGASLCRATGFGSRFSEYFNAHNDAVLVVVMLEHIAAVQNADAILATPGLDAVLIGPYDLSASMGLAGQLQHPDVLAARRPSSTPAAGARSPPASTWCRWTPTRYGGGSGKASASSPAGLTRCLSGKVAVPC